MILVRILWRLIVASLAYLIACLAAGAFIVVATIGERAWTADGAFTRAEVIAQSALLSGFVGLIVALFAFAPAVVVIVVSEALRLRGFVFHAAAGAVAAALAHAAAGHGRLTDLAREAPVDRDLGLFLAAGLAGGIVYWLIAGRGAGITAPAR